MGTVPGRLIIIAILCQISEHFSFHVFSAKDIPAFYIFGDSLVDAGNNFYIQSRARPEFPNGIDFGNPFGTPSGRFTNGRTVVDIVGQEVGLKSFPPPSMAPTTTGEVLLMGVNYGSSASGIFSDTGSKFGKQINFDTQISYFEKTRREIISNIGVPAAKKLLRQALYVAAIGSNDIGSWAASRMPKSLSLDAYLDTVISRFRSQLRRLYELDARKIIVTNSGAAGCIPFVRDQFPSIDGCFQLQNQIAQSYNTKLKTLLEELSTNLTGSTFVYADIYAISEDIIQNYIIYGFENVDTACCSIAGIHGGLYPCRSISQVCLDRTKYVFWDPFHLTETANLIAAKHMMDGGLNYVSPMNIRQLVNS